MRVYRRERSSRWWIDARSVRPGLRVPGFTDRAATDALGRQIVRLGAHVGAGDVLPLDLVRWLEGLPERIRRPLVRKGLIGEQRLLSVRPLREHVDEWEGWLAARRTAKHAQLSARRVRRLLRELGWRYWSDLEPLRLQTFLRELVDAGWPSRETPRPLAARTSNAHLQAVRQFCGWMVEQSRAVADPLASVAHLSEQRLGRAKVRRALSDEEIAALLAATREGPVRGRLTGPERELIYRLALETALRANELRHLEVRDLHLGDEPHLIVRAAYAKSEREDRLPLRAEVAAELRPLLAGRHPRARVFGRFFSQSQQARILQTDLLAAGIPHENEQGESVDFHALRHTAVSRWARAGLAPKLLQRLARHTTARLTMDVYTHTSVAEESAALQSVPPVPTTTGPQREDVARTGTDECASQCAIPLSSHGPERPRAGSVAETPPSASLRPVPAEDGSSDDDALPLREDAPEGMIRATKAGVAELVDATDSKSGRDSAQAPEPPTGYEEAVEALCLSLCLSGGATRVLRDLIEGFRASLTKKCQQCAGSGEVPGSTIGATVDGTYACPWCCGTGQEGGA